MVLDNKEYKLGLALSGGGARGFAHLGLMQALIEKGIQPDIISGTSAGALAGAFIADGKEPKEVLSLFKSKSFNAFGEMTIPKTGIFKTERFRKFLEKNLNAHTFEELQMPLTVIATDIELGEIAAFSSGKLIPSIIASCSVPIVFTPVKINDKHYVDGGLLKNFPVSPIRKKCDVIIGSNVSPLTTTEYKDSLKYIVERSYHYLSVSNTFLDRNLCDFLIEFTDFSKYFMFDLDHVDDLFQIGYDFTINYLKENEDKIKDRLKDK